LRDSAPEGTVQAALGLHDAARGRLFPSTDSPAPFLVTSPVDAPGHDDDQKIRKSENQKIRKSTRVKPEASEQPKFCSLALTGTAALGLALFPWPSHAIDLAGNPKATTCQFAESVSLETETHGG